MQHRIKWESEYKSKNIIRLIIEVNEILDYEFALNVSNWHECQLKTFDTIYMICCEISTLSESQLQKVVVSCLAKVLFYLRDSSTMNNFLVNRNKAVNELCEQRLLI